MKELRYSFIVFIAYFLCTHMCARTCSANILYLSTTACPSHNIWDKTLAISLRDRGHHITYVTNSPEESMENFTAIVLEGVREILLSEVHLESTGSKNTMTDIKLLFEWIYRSCQLNIKTEGWKQLLQLAKDGKKFDLIIFDITMGFCYYPIVGLFGNPPLVATASGGIIPLMTENFGIDMQISYVAHYSLFYTDKMNIIQRMHNYFIQMYEMGMKYYYWGKIKKLLDEFYGKDLKHIYEVEKNFSIFLTNYDPILDYPRPLPPDVIPVGGLHTKRAKELSQDLQNYLDNSTDGVIMFSLGTNIRSDKLESKKKKLILDAFAQLRQNVVWKFESDIADLPKNVIVRKFLPQNDILAHPNVQLLINHGGALSSQEAMFHGVPIITIPFFMDQRTISHKIVNRKIGASLNFETLTLDNLVSTIKEIINNPIYKENAQKLSRTYRDRPDDPLDRAIFWVEHVLRHEGAEHFRLAARQMSFYQTNLLDIWMLIIGIPILGIVIIEKINFKTIIKKQKLKCN